MTGPIPIPVYIGLPAPSSAPEDGEAWNLWTSATAPETRRTPLADAAVDWQGLGVEPRWLESETVECVAALEPGRLTVRWSKELTRLLEGAKARDEMALVVKMLGRASIDTPDGSVAAAEDDSLFLPGFQGSIEARRLPAGARPQLAAGLSAAEQDLGKRLLNRPAAAQWWTLSLVDTALESPGRHGVQKMSPLPGELEPILVDSLGKPVVAAWVPEQQNQRWYIVPDAIVWSSVIDWLVQQAIPYYIPDAPRRFRTAGFVDPAWQTQREQRAGDALAAMEIRHLEERARLEAELEDARRAAEVVRDGLLYGSGGELVRAVDQALSDAGISTIDLDTSEKGTWSADLLASADGPARLVEVKSEGGRAKEALVGDLRKHLDTWRAEYPDKPVSGGTLIVNHQRKTAPEKRDPQVYSRPEFVKALPVKVVGTVDLFRWWKESDWPAIREAVLGEGNSSGDDCSAVKATPGAPKGLQRRGTWFRRRSNTS
ncbi:hypothetical protein [Nocardia aurantiaca]|uniref:Uncharacterized protein n=1 Tax=Nocardia aurantiaca TaxID=2675850 RepID=A0A6I3L591_9NOCA|nr:hypothetical protein [Nocardia aurantiaca]MTE17037.1 hypothetical protein [Nocardia aurantiaca]